MSAIGIVVELSGDSADYPMPLIAITIAAIVSVSPMLNGADLKTESDIVQALA